MIALINKKTGEYINMNINKQGVQSYVESLSDEAKSDVLKQVNWVKRVTTAMDKAIKDYIKTQTEINDDEGFGEWHGHKVSRVNRYVFDKKKLEKEGSEEEKEIIRKAEKIQEKYKSPKSYLKVQ